MNVSESIKLSQIIPDFEILDDFDDFAHQPCIATNENYDLQKIESLPPHGNLMIAVSCFFALNVYAVRKNLDYLLIVDRGSRVNIFWNKALEIIKETERPKDALESLKNHIIKDHETYFSSDDEEISAYDSALYRLKCLKEEFDNGVSFLSTEEKYKRVRSLLISQRFSIKQVDISDWEAMKKIGSLLKTHQLGLDILYISNVPKYSKDEDCIKYLYKSLPYLLKSDTHIIDSYLNHDHLEQRIYQLEDKDIKTALKVPNTHKRRKT